MPSGGFLSIQTICVGDYLKIKIKDTGNGIPDEFFNNIFDPFFTTRGRGIGMGLAMAKEIVDQYKGSIEFESEKDKYTIFNVKFPIKEIISEFV